MGINSVLGPNGYVVTDIDRPLANWSDSTGTAFARPDGTTYSPRQSVKVAVIGNSIVALGAGIANVNSDTGWTASTAKSVSNVVYPNYWDLRNGVAPIKWVCSTGGTTGTLEPDWPHAAAAGTTVTDGTVVWTATAFAGATQYRYNFGFWHIAQALSGQRLDEVVICGRSGQQSNDILLYMDRILAISEIGVIFFSAMFENDCWPGSAPSLATIAARWDAFVVAADKCRAMGKRVILSTLLPSGNIDASSAFTGYSFGNGSKAWLWLNDKIREYCNARGDVILWDAANVYTDANPANPVWPENTVTYLSQAGSGQQLKKTDGIHPYFSGNYLLGKSLSAVLTTNFQERNRFTTALDHQNNAVNPLNFGTSGTRDATINTGTVPNSLTMAAFGGTAASCASSAVARTDINGNFARLVYVAAAGDNANLNWTSAATPAFSVGDVVQGFAEVRVLANPTLFVNFEMRVRFIGATEQWVYSQTSVSSDQDYGQMITADTLFTIKTPPTPVPTGTTTINAYVKGVARGAASFTVDYGRVAVMRRTQSSLA